MASRRHLGLALFAALLAPAARAGAQDTNAFELDDVQIHAFVSQGFLLTSNNNYLAESKDGSFEFSEVGINFTKPLTDKLRTGIQLFARDLGPIGNYSARLDWYYLDYHFEDWFGLRAGRVKLPFGLYNDVNDVDAARAPVLLPQSVYPIENRDFLLAQTGGEMYGRINLMRAGALEYRAYGGTIFIDTETPPGAPYKIKRLTIPYVVGGRLLWETPLPGLRAGGSVQYLRLDTDLLYDMAAWMAVPSLPKTFNGVVKSEIPALLWVGSIEYALNDLLLAAEYSRWHVRVDSSEPALFPEQKVTSERAYVMAAYRVTQWLQPGVYYSLLFPDVRDRKGRESQQHDVAATLRFDINAHWLVKLEGHFMHGTAALKTALNDQTPLSQLTRNWELYLVKTTAYF